MSVGVLLKKAKESLLKDGPFALAKKTKNYVVFKFQTGFKKDEMRDVLFVNGCMLPHPRRYRVSHQMEQLEASGLTVNEVQYQGFDPEIIKFYRAVIIYRCPITDNVKRLIEKAKYHNKKVFFDIDDLVIDKKFTDKIEYIQQMTTEERALYDDGVVRMGETMKMCDYVITTTRALKRELERYGKEVFVNKNVASEEMVKLSIEAKNNAKKERDKIRIGYLSGSITHNPDFELIKPALVKIMREYNNVELVVMGYLELSKDMKEFEDRIIRRPFVDWRELPAVIAGLDINLAPIEKSVFNEAKSENKWTEAALCDVVTVASDFGAFADVIEDGKTGMLCANGDEWYKKIKELIESPNLRIEIGRNANKKAMEEYVVTYTGLPLARFVKSKLARNVAFVLPSTNVSGGVNVVLKHCAILREAGWDAMVINMDKDEENIINDDGEVLVVSGVKHDIVARFDEMVATLYTTLKYVKEYPEVANRLYIVQGFETEFGEYGNPLRKLANATYSAMDNVRYVTVSLWCKKWLKKRFEKEARYAPNGIDASKFDFKERKFGKKIRILIEGNSEDYYKNTDEAFRVVDCLDKEKYEIHYLSYRGKPKEWYRVDKFYHQISHDEIGRVYSGCDILLKTSILESFSYPPLEMMATGGYVVAVPNGGNMEYLKDGKNCLFYEQGNIEQAVEKIEMIVGDEKLREKLLSGAKETVAERDWKDIKDKVLELYR